MSHIEVFAAEEELVTLVNYRLECLEEVITIGKMDSLAPTQNVLVTLTLNPFKFSNQLKLN